MNMNKNTILDQWNGRNFNLVYLWLALFLVHSVESMKGFLDILQEFVFSVLSHNGNFSYDFQGAKFGLAFFYLPSHL